MRNNKRIMLTLGLMVFFSLGVNAGKVLVIWLASDSQVYYPLNEQPVIAYPENMLVVKTTDKEVSCDRSQIRKYTIEENQTTSVDVKTAPRQSATVTVHTLSGSCLYNETLDAGKTTSILQQRLSPGTYIITINGQSHKYQIK